MARMEEMELRLVFTRENMGSARYLLTETMETRPGALKKKGGLTQMCPTPPCLYFSPISTISLPPSHSSL